MSENTKIGIAGCSGRVGALLVQELKSSAWPDLKITAGSVRSGQENNCEHSDILITNNAEELLSHSDIVIDFTTADLTIELANLAAQSKKSLVIGTTGLSEEQEQELKKASKESAIVYAANMSVGVNLLVSLVQKVAGTLGPDYDIEILETHHKHKKDAPSGTALALGNAAQSGRGNANFIYERYGDTGERPSGDIGYAVRRGGNVVGEHIVSFFGDGERIELTHKATDRSLFAKGALHAARWIKDKPAGLYTMHDVLEL